MSKLILPSSPPCIGVAINLWLPPDCRRSLLLGQLVISANYRPHPKRTDGLPDMSGFFYAHNNFENADIDGYATVTSFDPRKTTPFQLVADMLTSLRSGKPVLSSPTPRRECRLWHPNWWVEET